LHAVQINIDCGGFRSKLPLKVEFVYITRK